MALELQGRLREAIRNQVRETLGERVEVLQVQIEKGSVTLLIVLGAVGTFFMGFSRYESFIKSVNLLVQQLKDLVSRLFGDAPFGGPQIPVSVSGAWQPGPSIEAANDAFAQPSGADLNRLLLAYLIGSHAVLLGVLLWLVVRHVI